MTIIPSGRGRCDVKKFFEECLKMYDKVSFVGLMIMNTNEEKF